MGAIASLAIVAAPSARAVVRLAAILFALGSFAVFVGAGGRRHAKPPVDRAHRRAHVCVRKYDAGGRTT